MNAVDYEFLSGFLLQSMGLSLGSGKEYLLEARLIPLAQSLGLQDFDQLVSELRRGRDAKLKSAVTEAMTTNETSFFRDRTPFDDLKNTLIPALIASRANSRRLRIWCAAASTGQESYSVLMLIDEYFPQLKDWTIEFVATDISQNMLDRAADGTYSQFEVQRGLPITHLVKYFTQSTRGWTIKDSLKNRVRWQKLNLLDNFGLLGNFDLVMCRNVLIYFDASTKKNILDRVARLLPADGFLMLGAAETVLGITDTFSRFKLGQSAVYTPVR